MEGIQFYPLGDAAITVQLGEVSDIEVHHKVRGLVTYLEEHPLSGMVELVPGFTTVTVFYDPLQLSYPHSYEQIRDELKQALLSSSLSIEEQRIVTIPVCYGGEFGPDLHTVASSAGISPEEVISRHAKQDYTVYMIGFAPGFPYLGGMDESLAISRRSSPRLFIPAGSVGIGGKQTGIYPLESPGGWHIIGRTPLALFDTSRECPSLLQAGDLVRFQPISLEEYEEWGKAK